MPIIEGFKSYVSYTVLGGSKVDPEEVLNELARWPLDGILGFLGKLSLEAVKAGDDFTNPTRQGKYLNWAIVDDFPCVLPNVSKMYAPGRVPITGGRHLLLHEQNIAWLAHLAIIYAKEGLVTPEFSWDLRKRMCRLLLISNDFFSGYPSNIHTTLKERQIFALNWLRHWQFNSYFNHLMLNMSKLARQFIILHDILPEFYPEVKSSFVEATNGISLERYFEILIVFITHINHGMEKGHWFSMNDLCKNIQCNGSEIELILKRWSRTPEQYRLSFEKWKSIRPMADDYIHNFDYVVLRETPLIEARPGELICPVLSFLLAKIMDDPYFILSTHLGKDSQRFQTALGKAYEKYAQTLVERIASTDKGGRWFLRNNPRTKKAGELSDSYIQREDVAITFEHKGQRPGTEFLRGGSGERVLGPSEAVLNLLDSKINVGLKEGRDSDEGVLTRGMWQQSLAGHNLLVWSRKETGVQPKIIYPIITFLHTFRVDRLLRLAYLEPLIESAQLYNDIFWESPQWLHVSDLEWLVALAKQGDLDIIALLQEKKLKSHNERFDIFLHSLGPRLIDKNLAEKAIELMGNAMESFWPHNL